MVPADANQERRRHPRVRKNYILRFYDRANPSMKVNVSQVENISQGGMCFSSTMPLKEGGVIAMELRTPYLSDTIYLEGNILDCREKVPGLIYENRIKFLELSAGALDVLAKIEKYNSNKKA